MRGGTDLLELLFLPFLPVRSNQHHFHSTLPAACLVLAYLISKFSSNRRVFSFQTVPLLSVNLHSNHQWPQSAVLQCRYTAWRHGSYLILWTRCDEMKFSFLSHPTTSTRLRRGQQRDWATGSGDRPSITVGVASTKSPLDQKTRKTGQNPRV